MRILSFLIALSVAAFVIIYPRAIASDMSSVPHPSSFRNELLLCLRSRLQSQKSILSLLILPAGRMDLCRSGKFHDFFQTPVA